MTKLPDLVSEKESQKWKENVIVKLVNICFISKPLTYYIDNQTVIEYSDGITEYRR